MEPIILASASPRRAEYFRLLGLPFSSVAPDLDESYEPGSEPEFVVKGLAIGKVRRILEMLKGKEAPWVCGADTLISLDGIIRGKPANRSEAEQMLLSFSGRSHEVISAVALYSGGSKIIDCRTVTSSVSFAPLSRDEIEWYLDSGEWEDAAGAYKIQGLASCFITEIKGSYSSIVGLPLREIYAMLRDNGYPYGG